MALYLLKFSGCLLIFLAFYKLVLEKENMHVFKRFFLLGALAVSIIIPFVTFTQYIEPITDFGLYNPNSLNTPPYFPAETISTTEKSISYLPTILWAVYVIGVLLFGFKFIRNLYRLNHKIKHNPKQRYYKFTHVLLKDLIVPHTFFNYIFFNKSKFEANEIPEEVFWHEQTHATQKHSIDVVFIEALQVLLWFNPLIYIIKHAIKLNHEFLADQGVLRKGINTNTYQEIILAFSSNAAQPQLANAINYSLIKKRFTVMKTQTTKRGIWLRSLILLPLLAIMLYSFSETKIIEKDIAESTDSFLQDFNTNSEGATEAMMEEYNAFIDSYEGTNMIIMGKYNRAVAIYEMMTTEQRESVKKLPKSLPTDLSKKKAKKPTENEVNSWKNKSEFAIWIDGKVADNSVLNNYSSTDFVHYFQSKVYKNARSERFPQPFQVNIYTKKGFENAFINSNINKYKSQAKKYTDALNNWLKGNRTDNSELRILKAQADKVYSSLSKDDIAKHNLLQTPPIPSTNSQETTNHTARSIDIEVFDNGTYKIDGLKATKKTFASVINQLHQDITPEIRNRIINVHVNNGKAVLDEDVWFIYNSVIDYGFHRIVTYNQEIIREKGNKPFAITNTVTQEQSNAIFNKSEQKKATKEQIAEYNKISKHYNSQPKDKRIYKQRDLERLKYLYSLMSAAQKKDAEPFPNIPPPPPPAPNTPRVIEVEAAMPPPPPPIPANATPEQKAKYKKIIAEYAKRNPKSVTKHKTKNGEVIEVVEIPTSMLPPPPPPPVPDNATPEQKKKYKENIKKYELAVAESRQNMAKIREAKNTERAQLIEAKEQYAAERKALQEVKLARVAEMEERKEKLEQQKLQRVVERQAISEERKAQLVKEKLKYVEERKAETEKLKKEKLKHVEERKVLAEEKRKLAKIERLKRDLPPPPPPPKSPLDHVIEMAKKDAVFYFEGKEISSDEAIKKLKQNKRMNVRTISRDSNRPKVHLSTKPMVVEIKEKN